MHLAPRFYRMIVSVFCLWVLGCREPSPTITAIKPPNEIETSTPVVATNFPPPQIDQATFVSNIEPVVRDFCSSCHASPDPATSPKDEWAGEVDQGFGFYEHSRRTDLTVPSRDDVLRYFQIRAPEKVTLPESIYTYPSAPLSFQPKLVRAGGTRPPGVTNVQWLELGIDQARSLVYCDIGSGGVFAFNPQTSDKPPRRLATLLQPVHSETCDLNNDGRIDLVIADIGEFQANDGDLGRVVWLRRSPIDDSFDSIVLKDGLSRVSDARAGDFDGDGDTDLLVAEFGWRSTGSIFWMERLGTNEDLAHDFVMHPIDPRHGAIHVPPVDLDQDGDLDFIAVISQEHETIDAFINDGAGKFTREMIWSAPNPAYGSSGIDLVDMDQDGDLDLLYTNGDSFDRGVKPQHSVQWLENQGGYPYIHHPLCAMAGVETAKTGDFNGDGRLDIVAGSLIAHTPTPDRPLQNAVSIAMLLQLPDGKFMPYKIEAGVHQHLSTVVADFDDDGDTDFAVANFHRNGTPTEPDLVLYLNASTLASKP